LKTHILFFFAFLLPSFCLGEISLYYKYGGVNRNYSGNAGTNPASPYIHAQNARLAGETDRVLRAALSGTGIGVKLSPDLIKSNPQFAIQQAWIDQVALTFSDPRVQDVCGDLRREGVTCLGIALLVDYLRTNNRNSWFPEWEEIDYARSAIESKLREVRKELLADVKSIS
jgi:hypothetical protein